MNKKIRAIIFYTLAIFFVFIGTTLVLYSKGWKFDLKSFAFYQSGAINIAGQPENSLIKIEEIEYQINSQNNKNQTLITGLKPSTYTLRVEKIGYQSWTKTVAVEAAVVTQIYPIILMENQATTTPVAQNIKNFWIGPRYQALKSTSGRLTINGAKANGNDIVDWFINGKKALTYDKTDKNYIVIDIGKTNAALNVSLIFKNLKEKTGLTDSDQSPKIIPHPSDDNKVIVMTATKLYILDFAKFDITAFPQSSSSFILAKNNELFFADKTGLYSFDMVTKNKKIISAKIIKKPEISDISSDNSSLALLSDKKLTIVFLSNKEIKTISSSANQFKFSPDGEKLAYLETDGRIKIFFLKDQPGWGGKKSGESADLGIHQLASKNSFDWHANSAYLFLNYPDKISLIEIDDRSPINEQFIIGKTDNRVYDLKNNSLYILNTGNLSKIVF